MLCHILRKPEIQLSIYTLISAALIIQEMERSVHSGSGSETVTFVEKKRELPQKMSKATFATYLILLLSVKTKNAVPAIWPMSQLVFLNRNRRAILNPGSTASIDPGLMRNSSRKAVAGYIGLLGEAILDVEKLLEACEGNPYFSHWASNLEHASISSARCLTSVYCTIFFETFTQSALFETKT